MFELIIYDNLLLKTDKLNKTTLISFLTNQKNFFSKQKFSFKNLWQYIKSVLEKYIKQKIYNAELNIETQMN